jgi:monoamine oxidase
VTAHTDVGSVRARRAILAMPPPLAARIRYTPELPAMRDQLTQRAGMGATVKVFLRYERAFWRERGLSGEGVSTDGPVGACFDDGLAGSGPGLLAFIVGRAARGWSARPPGDRRDAVLAQLARWYGDEAKRPRALHEVDWADDPWTRGAPIATFPPGTLSVLGPALRAPCGRLHWAGTETARESTGFMEGALESGERAAAEVLAAG